MEGLSESEEMALSEGLHWEPNMANRRNHSRHRGMADNFHGSSGEPAEANASSLEYLAATGEDPAQASSSEKVARAKKLISDPGYPPKEVLNSIAGLLAEHLDPNGPS